RIHGRPWQNWTPGFHYMFDVGPLEFLDCIANAKCVLTTTFHGTCFALNFGVPFYPFIEHNSHDTPIANLLTLLGLTDRLFDFGQGNAITSVTTLNNSYKARLDAERQTSLSYLKAALA
ncbi:MAG: polysaccharide pyruvyl transferase family protein, partial [Victivallales bacterium]|nr:polysaccharide pyruvyl transferase family protein [Victivallales bacterium]